MNLLISSCVSHRKHKDRVMEGGQLLPTLILTPSTPHPLLPSDTTLHFMLPLADKQKKTTRRGKTFFLTYCIFKLHYFKEV